RAGRARHRPRRSGDREGLPGRAGHHVDAGGHRRRDQRDDRLPAGDHRPALDGEAGLMAVVSDVAVPAAPAPRPRPLVRPFFRSPRGLTAAVVLGIILIVAIVAPIVLGGTADTLDTSGTPYAPASWSHPLGTDQLGRDQLSRVLVATRLSIGLALI